MRFFEYFGYFIAYLIWGLLINIVISITGWLLEWPIECVRLAVEIGIMTIVLAPILSWENNKNTPEIAFQPNRALAFQLRSPLYYILKIKGFFIFLRNLLALN